jgi:DNA modification methylase
MVTLHQGDCLEVMRGFDDEIIDLTVTSPPYDNLRTYNGYVFDFEGIAQQLYRVTKPGGVVVWVVGDATINGSETGTSFRQALYFKDVCGFNLHDTMIYRKLNGAMGSNYTYLQEYEYMFVLTKGTPATVNFIRDRKNVECSNKSTPKKKSDATGSLVERHIVKRAEYGRRKNIWDYPVGGPQELGYHPAPFPEALARDHILSWSNPGDLVFDPMMGSGTTGKMAVKYQRRFLGIEISEEYFAIAQKRINQAKQQMIMPLFGATP